MKEVERRRSTGEMSAGGEWTKMCAFCGGRSGEFLPVNRRNGVALHVHEACVEWAPKCYQNENGKWMGIRNEVKRSGKLRCPVCNKGHAALGCAVPSCKRSYHLECAKVADCSFNEETYTILCPEHRNEEHPKRVRVDQDAMHREEDDTGTRDPSQKIKKCRPADMSTDDAAHEEEEDDEETSWDGGGDDDGDDEDDEEEDELPLAHLQMRRTDDDAANDMRPANTATTDVAGPSRAEGTHNKQRQRQRKSASSKARQTKTTRKRRRKHQHASAPYEDDESNGEDEDDDAMPPSTQDLEDGVEAKARRAKRRGHRLVRKNDSRFVVADDEERYSDWTPNTSEDDMPRGRGVRRAAATDATIKMGATHAKEQHTTQGAASDPERMIGTCLRKEFADRVYNGVVDGYNSHSKMFHVAYSDNDTEDMTPQELAALIDDDDDDVGAVNGTSEGRVVSNADTVGALASMEAMPPPSTAEGERDDDDDGDDTQEARHVSLKVVGMDAQTDVMQQHKKSDAPAQPPLADVIPTILRTAEAMPSGTDMRVLPSPEVVRRNRRKVQLDSDSDSDAPEGTDDRTYVGKPAMKRHGKGEAATGVELDPPPTAAERARPSSPGIGVVGDDDRRASPPTMAAAAARSPSPSDAAPVQKVVEPEPRRVALPVDDFVDRGDDDGNVADDDSDNFVRSDNDDISESDWTEGWEEEARGKDVLVRIDAQDTAQGPRRARGGDSKAHHKEMAARRRSASPSTMQVMRDSDADAGGGDDSDDDGYDDYDGDAADDDGELEILATDGDSSDDARLRAAKRNAELVGKRHLAKQDTRFIVSDDEERYSDWTEESDDNGVGDVGRRRNKPKETARDRVAEAMARHEILAGDDNVPSGDEFGIGQSDGDEYDEVGGNRKTSGKKKKKARSSSARYDDVRVHDAHNPDGDVWGSESEDEPSFDRNRKRRVGGRMTDFKERAGLSDKRRRRGNNDIFDDGGDERRRKRKSKSADKITRDKKQQQQRAKTKMREVWWSADPRCARKGRQTSMEEFGEEIIAAKDGATMINDGTMHQLLSKQLSDGSNAKTSTLPWAIDTVIPSPSESESVSSGIRNVAKRASAHFRVSSSALPVSEDEISRGEYHARIFGRRVNILCIDDALGELTDRFVACLHVLRDGPVTRPLGPCVDAEAPQNGLLTVVLPTKAEALAEIEAFFSLITALVYHIDGTHAHETLATLSRSALPDRTSFLTSLCAMLAEAERRCGNGFDVSGNNALSNGRFHWYKMLWFRSFPLMEAMPEENHGTAAPVDDDANDVAAHGLSQPHRRSQSIDRTTHGWTLSYLKRVAHELIDQVKRTNARGSSTRPPPLPFVALWSEWILAADGTVDKSGGAWKLLSTVLMERRNNVMRDTTATTDENDTTFQNRCAENVSHRVADANGGDTITTTLSKAKVFDARLVRHIEFEWEVLFLVCKLYLQVDMQLGYKERDAARSASSGCWAHVKDIFKLLPLDVVMNENLDLGMAMLGRCVSLSRHWEPDVEIPALMFHQLQAFVSSRPSDRSLQCACCSKIGPRMFDGASLEASWWRSIFSSKSMSVESIRRPALFLSSESASFIVLMIVDAHLSRFARNVADAKQKEKADDAKLREAKVRMVASKLFRELQQRGKHESDDASRSADPASSASRCIAIHCRHALQLLTVLRRHLPRDQHGLLMKRVLGTTTAATAAVAKSARVKAAAAAASSSGADIEMLGAVHLEGLIFFWMTALADTPPQQRREREFADDDARKAIWDFAASTLERLTPEKSGSLRKEQSGLGCLILRSCRVLVTSELLDPLQCVPVLSALLRRYASLPQSVFKNSCNALVACVMRLLQNTASSLLRENVPETLVAREAADIIEQFVFHPALGILRSLATAAHQQQRAPGASHRPMPLAAALTRSADGKLSCSAVMPISAGSWALLLRLGRASVGDILVSVPLYDAQSAIVNEAMCTFMSHLMTLDGGMALTRSTDAGACMWSTAVMHLLCDGSSRAEPSALILRTLASFQQGEKWAKTLRDVDMLYFSKTKADDAAPDARTDFANRLMHMRNGAVAGAMAGGSSSGGGQYAHRHRGHTAASDAKRIDDIRRCIGVLWLARSAMAVCGSSSVTNDPRLDVRPASNFVHNGVGQLLMMCADESAIPMSTSARVISSIASLVVAEMHWTGGESPRRLNAVMLSSCIPLVRLVHRCLVQIENASNASSTSVACRLLAATFDALATIAKEDLVSAKLSSVRARRRGDCAGDDDDDDDDDNNNQNAPPLTGMHVSLLRYFIDIVVFVAARQAARCVLRLRQAGNAAFTSSVGRHHGSLTNLRDSLSAALHHGAPPSSALGTLIRNRMPTNRVHVGAGGRKTLSDADVVMTVAREMEHQGALTPRTSTVRRILPISSISERYRAPGATTTGLSSSSIATPGTVRMPIEYGGRGDDASGDMYSINLGLLSSSLALLASLSDCGGPNCASVGQYQNYMVLSLKVAEAEGGRDADRRAALEVIRTPVSRILQSAQSRAMRQRLNVSEALNPN